MTEPRPTPGSVDAEDPDESARGEVELPNADGLDASVVTDVTQPDDSLPEEGAERTASLFLSSP
jgi:hypothetical protein